MPEVYAVETALTLSDRQLLSGLRAVGRELRTLGSEAAKLQASLKAMGATPMIAGAGLGQLQKMRAAMAGVATEATKARAALAAMEINPAAVTSASALSRSLGAATTRAAALRNELARMPGGFGPGGRGPGGRGPGGRDPFHTRIGAGPVDSRLPVGVGEAGALIVGFGMFEGIKKAASEQQALFYSVLAGGMDPRSPQGREFADKIRQAAVEAQRGTIYSLLDVEKMIPSIAGTSLKDLQDTMPFLRPAILFGEQEEMEGAANNKTWGAAESAKAAIRIAHLLKITDPSKFPKILDLIGPTTLAGDMSPAQLQKSLQYMAGSAGGLGFTPAETLNLAALSSTYLSGTTAGTGVNMMLQGLQPRGGPGAGTKIQENWLKRRTALEKAGFLDPKTHHLYTEAEGRTERPFLQHLADFAKAHPKDSYGFFSQMFGGQRGARAAQALSAPGVLAQYDVLDARQKEYPRMGGFEGAQKAGMSLLTNQSKQASASLQTILQDMGTGTVPALTAAFNALNPVLSAIADMIDPKKHPVRNQVLGDTALGAGALGGGWALWRLAKWFKGGAPRAAAMAIPEIGAAEIGSAVGGGASLGFGLPAAAIVASAVGSYWVAKNAAEQIRKGELPYTGLDPNIDPFNMAHTGSVAAGNRTRGTAEHGGRVELTGNVNLQTEVHVNFGQLGEMIARAVSKGIMHASTGGTAGSGAGPDISGSLMPSTSGF